jgi:biopolymer transport protein TolR
MGMPVGGSKRGIMREMNVVPLIDILLVLLVIFMIIPNSRGMKVEIPQPGPAGTPAKREPDDVIVVQVLADGSLKLNQQPVQWDTLRDRLQEVFKFRADRVGFVRGDGLVEFQAVAKVIDDMRAAGILSVGLLTPELETSH